MSALKEKYKKEVVPKLMQRLNLKNIHEVPKIEKIVINVGCGEAARDAQMLKGVERDLALITGQKPKINRAKKSISNFKIRKGMIVGASVTLRGDRMYEFLERFVFVAVPRIRDFRGFRKKAFDGKGNYNIGIKEHTIFTEVNLDDVIKPFGMNITINTTAKDDESAYALLDELGFPFAK